MLDRIIVDLGGPSAVARALGIRDYTTVSSWVRRRSIPVSYWPGLIELAASKGVALDERQMLAAHVAGAAAVHSDAPARPAA